MPTATKRKTTARRRTTLSQIGREMARLRARVEDLEDLRDINAAIDRNQGKPGTPWEQAKRELGLE